MVNPATAPPLIADQGRAPLNRSDNRQQTFRTRILAKLGRLVKERASRRLTIENATPNDVSFTENCTPANRIGQPG